MRLHNITLLLRALFSQEPVSRAALARSTGLARSTVTTIVQQLCEAELVEESHVTESRGGRPPIALKVSRNRHHLIGIELGATHITVVRTDLQGGVQRVVEEACPVETDPEGTLSRIERLVRGLTLASEPPVVGIGLAVPSPLDPARPGQLSPRILPAWTGIDVASRLGSALGVPVVMENDANLGALAESRWGIGSDKGDFAYVKIATGVGAGLLVDGQIYRGATGIAGEIGHSAVRRGGPRCRCGLQGCLEASIGTSALVQEGRRVLREAGDVRAAGLDLDGLISAVEAGEPWAVDIIASAGHDLGVAIANLLNLLNPSAVVLGGTLTRAREHLIAPLRRALEERSLVTSVESSQVVVSSLGDRAIALGGAALVLEHALSTPSVLLETGSLSP